MKFYTEEEVLLHSIPEDCWISVFDDIFDITALLKSSEGNETKSLFKYAGKSVSHWFNEETGEIKTFVDPLRNVTLPYVPLHEGNILYVPSPDPTTEINIDILPWWKNSSLIVGKITKQSRSICVINTLTKQENTFLICDEYSINDIQNKYIQEVNGQASSYTWKMMLNSELINLNMNRTLHENGVIFDTKSEANLNVPHITTLFLYYNDDLLND